MNERITLPSLVGLLANQTGKPKKQCEDFLREFFNTIIETLSAGENVRVKSLGTFKVVAVEPRKSINVNTGEQMEIPSHHKIVFVPAKELAENVNAPFAMFESVEIPDEIDESGDSITEEAETYSAETINERQEETTETDTSTSHTYTETGSKSELESDTCSETETVADMETPPKRHRFLIGFICGAACAGILCTCAYIFLPQEWRESLKPGKENITTIAINKDTAAERGNAAMQADTIKKVSVTTDVSDTGQNNDKTSDNDESVPTRPSDEKVYDTISKTRYLTTMAKQHYGNFNLWPYIYEENKAFLGHPDRIKPGTKVVIPPLSKYGVDPSNPEDIRRAKRKGVEIYSRYQ